MMRTLAPMKEVLKCKDASWLLLGQDTPTITMNLGDIPDSPPGIDPLQAMGTTLVPRTTAQPLTLQLEPPKKVGSSSIGMSCQLKETVAPRTTCPLEGLVLLIAVART